MSSGQSSSNIYVGFNPEAPWSRPDPEPASPEPITVTTQTAVSMKISAHVASTEGKEANLIFSPLLIQLVLGLIAAGSNGPTRKQLLGFLGSESVDDLNRVAREMISAAVSSDRSGDDEGGPELSLVNGVWIDQSVGFKETFKNIVEDIYKAACQQVDFQNEATKVANEVNSWVENNTNGLIKELIPFGSIDSNTRLILANSLYFKGAWAERFDSSFTSDSDFHLLHGGSVKTPFMTSHEGQYISAFNGFKVLRLFYRRSRSRDDNRRLSIYIFLPDAIDGLPSLLEKASSQPDFLDQHVPKQKVGVKKFMVPKFKFTFEFEASSTLKQLGLTLPFDSPDFTNMVENLGKDLRVSKVFHKSFIEVNEEGTEAAAATALVMVPMCLITYDVELDFVADHPFVFFIREDESGVVLFNGHVMNPAT